MTQSGSAAPVGALSNLLRQKPKRATLEVGNDRLRVAVHMDEEIFTKPDPGYGEYVARRLTREFHGDLLHADQLARQSVRGAIRKIMTDDLTKQTEHYDADNLIIDGQQVMQAWEHPYMQKLAQISAASHGDVLEIGFGMGISASAIQDIGVRSHTIIECHPDVQNRFATWRSTFPGNDINLVEGKWQDRIDECGQYDAILFDAYPVNEREWDEHYVNDVTFARHFFEVAAQHLRDGGVFTYYSNEVDSMSRGHQRALFKYFSTITTSVISGLRPPDDCHYWQTDSFLVISASKN